MTGGCVGYIVTTEDGQRNGRTLAWCKKNLNAKAHWEPRKKTHEQCIAYCSKDDTRAPGSTPTIVGEWNDTTSGPKGVGQRHVVAIKDLMAAVAAGKSNKELYQTPEFASLMFRMPTHVDKYRNTITVKHRTWQTKNLYLWGPTGTGKTSKAKEYAALYDEDDVFWASAPAGDRMWFEGYTGQPVVIFDELTGGWMKYGVLLDLLGNKPYMVEYKGSSTNWLPEIIIITSNYAPEKLYKEETVPDHSALLRRLTGVCGHQVFMNEPYVHPLATGETAEQWFGREIEKRKALQKPHSPSTKIIDLTDDETAAWDDEEIFENDDGGGREDDFDTYDDNDHQALSDSEADEALWDAETTPRVYCDCMIGDLPCDIVASRGKRAAPILAVGPPVEAALNKPGRFKKPRTASKVQRTLSFHRVDDDE